MEKLSVVKFSEYIAIRIKDECLARHESLKSVARNCGLSAFTIFNLHRASFSSIKKICKYLNLDVIKLLADASNYAKQYEGQEIEVANEKELYVENAQKIIKQKIRYLRENLKETRTEFAQHSQIAQNTMYRLENLHSDLKLMTLIKVVNYAKVSLQDFFNQGSDNPKQVDTINYEKLSVTIGEHIKKFRINKNESINMFSKNCSVKPGTIRQIEAGNGNKYKITTFAKIAYYMDISLQNLFCEAELPADAQYDKNKEI